MAPISATVCHHGKILPTYGCFKIHSSIPFQSKEMISHGKSHGKNITWHLLDQGLSETQKGSGQLMEEVPFHQWEACQPQNED